MKSLSTSEIRRRFLAYFEARDHRVVRSASLVPVGDPTLLFTNAGMNQFKEVFLGRETRDYVRATSSQKCVRAGGKHNDLENVGFTARHHTFFEMLGNFSFGDYFKRDAIRYAWEFLTSEMGLPVDRLWITVFRDDDEAAEIWEQDVGVASERIGRLGEKDNFWQMGDTGPCGPCSEIHFYQGDHLPCAEETCLGVECECDRYLEIWNLVFMQYDRDAEGVLHPLPSPSIDTGMGLERIAAVVQGHDSNYDIDLFREIIASVETLSGKTYGATAGDDDVSMRVIADHARATAFLVGDGVLPAPDGRGYVLRRIMRRAIRHGQRLGLEALFLARVCEGVIDAMRAAYPELEEQRAFIVKVAEQEEQSFRRTLDRGLKILDQALSELAPGAVLPGDVAFKLYDTYGFPLDLTEVICRERGFTVDTRGFEAALQAQRAGSEWKGSGEAADTAVHKQLAEELGPTEFLGYETERGEGKVLAILREGHQVDRAEVGDRVEVVLDRTPFYGEGGGQIGDTGTLWLGTDPAAGSVKVEDTLKPSGLFIHRGVIEVGTLKRGATVHPAVDGERRRRIRANHSATHLLQLTLKQVLGDHVKQAGSLVSDELLRFDYTHFEAPTPEQLAEVERRLNDYVSRNAETTTEVLPFDEAKGRGALAMFGEKYGEVVRTVRIGDDSLELCGGTHVHRAGDIGLFKIVSESSISAGVRRLTAYTQERAVQHVQEEEQALREAAAAMKTSPLEVARKADQAVRRIKELEKQVQALEQRLATARAVDVMDDVREVNGVKVLSIRTETSDPKRLRELADKLRDQLGSGVVVLGAERDGKAALLVAVTRDLTQRFTAPDLIKVIAPMVGGKGGGKPDLAQAGGTEPAHLDAALSRVYELIPAA